MKKFNRILSMLLAVLMIMSAFTALTAISALADDSAAGGENKTEADDGLNGKKPLNSQKTEDYTTKIYATPEEKLATMRVAVETEEFKLYVDDFSGEVACENKITGERIFTNPYDVGTSTGNETTKYEILSQIIVTFKDNAQGGLLKTFTSYEQSALRGQIITENIKNGVRVEYTIGREQAKTLVPRLISMERFEEMILAKLEEAFWDEEEDRTTLYDKADTKAKLDVQDFLTRYTLYSMDKVEMASDKRNSFGYVSDNLNASDRDKARVMKDYPVVAKMPVLVFDTTASEAEIAACEEIILKYCPEYTYEELEWDHAMTDYESEDENPPVFRLALEYKIEDGALSVRLPANGIRFNESLYTLESIDVLPYMGAGHSAYEGYNFFPDGSGTLFDFAELKTNTTRSVVGQVYGTDFAYHEIGGTYQEPIRYPVFGIYEETTYYNYEVRNIDTDEITSSATISGAIVDAVKAYQDGKSAGVCQGKESELLSLYGSTINNSNAEETKVTDKRGFVAIIEEGDALTSLTTYHAGSLSDYNTIKMSIVPRPKDTYNLQDSISVGSGGEFTIACDRKYVGSYKIKYILLSDTPAEEIEEKAENYKTYDTSWMGMAVAYRDYLTETGILTKKTETDVIDGSIPLYIETFGAVETTKKILSIPVQVMESLTTFEDIEEMYSYLSGQGINNINFKLTGYANGGMYYTVPGNLKFERVVGGNDGFQALLDAAADVNAESGKNFGIFPDFDIVYQLGDGWFDGYRQNDHAAKTIDDRYATRREYSATQQKYINYYEIVISPAYFDVLYNRMEKNYAKKYENVIGISVSTLGENLNSDFDEDEPYNREDSKQFTIDAFKHFDETYGSVMTDGGNAYVWKYADHILNVSLDSSRYIFSSNAVPFIGVVLHGSVSFAGEPLNMEGDMQYAILKAIENGASPYFILSMDNTDILKDYSDLSQYYSIRYDIWQEDIAGVYATLNKVLGDVQDKYIVGHQFLEGGVRIPDADELENDIYNALLKDIEDQENIAEILWWESKLEASNARKNGQYAEAHAKEAVAAVLSAYVDYQKAVSNVTRYDANYYDIAKEAYEYYYGVAANGDSTATSVANNIVNAALASGNSVYGFVAKHEAMDKTIADTKSALETAIAEYVAAYNATAPADKQLKADDYDYGVTTLDQAYISYYNLIKDRPGDDASAEDKAEYEEKKAKYLSIINDAELHRLADLFFQYQAAKNAKSKVVTSKYTMDFETYMQADARQSETYKFYNRFAKLVDDNTNDQEIAQVKEWYAECVANNAALDELDSQVTAASKASTTGNVDNYVASIAKVEVLEALGYKDSADESKKSEYDKAVNISKNYRISAVSGTANLQGSAYKTIVKYYESTTAQLVIATAAIDVLAKAEGVEVKYAEGSARTVRDIVNYDEIAIKSGIVKQAIDRATVVADAIDDSLTGCMAYASEKAVSVKQTAFDMAAKISKYDETFAADVQKRIDRENAVKDELPEEEVESKYSTENIVAVTYGDDNGAAYKTVILNYNNYTVSISVDYTDDGVDNAVLYTIPAYQFVTIDRTQN